MLITCKYYFISHEKGKNYMIDSHTKFILFFEWWQLTQLLNASFINSSFHFFLQVGSYAGAAWLLTVKNNNNRPGYSHKFQSKGVDAFLHLNFSSYLSLFFSYHISIIEICVRKWKCGMSLRIRNKTLNLLTNNEVSCFTNPFHFEATTVWMTYLQSGLLILKSSLILDEDLLDNTMWWLMSPCISLDPIKWSIIHSILSDAAL